MAHRQDIDLRYTANHERVVERPSQPKPLDGDKLSSKHFNKQLANAGLHQLIYTYREPRDCVLNVSTLQRMNLLVIQKKLVDIAAAIETNGTVSDNEQLEMRVALSDYATALRDWKLSSDASKTANGDLEADPFLITSTNTLQRSLLTKAQLLSGEDLDRVRQPWDWKNAYPTLPGKARTADNYKARMEQFGERLKAAIFGGIALVGPMLVMVLHKDLLTTLLTTSISVVLVALIAAWTLTEQSPADVLAIVAAYAAVLVVFVGVSQ